MKSGEPFFYHQLDNGLRVVVEPMPHAQSVAVGFLVKAGSRDETAPLAGASHFVEHMNFKGTAKRSWHDITIAFDQMGSYYNAFTSKDRTFYFGWVRPEDMQQQIELLADMMRSAFPEDQFDLEKKVILEEIAMSRDGLEHLVYDLIHEKLYAQHPLSWPVLGYRHTIEPMTRRQLLDYFQSCYAPQNTALIVTGRVEPAAVVDAAQQLCGQWQQTGQPAQRRPPPRPTQGTAVQPIDRFTQQAIALVFAAPSGIDEDREVARAAASIQGGENSRFYWNIVQAGIAPRAEARWLDYHDCGLMVLAGLCQPDKAEQLAEAMQREAATITSHGVADHEVQRVKNRRRTWLAAEAESPNYRLGQIADDIDYWGHAQTVEQRLAAVDAVTADRLTQYLRRWPITDQGYFVSVGPRDWPPT
jgi:predicted Zn-dependent peptidase